MKRKLMNALFALIFLIGFLVLAYPTISNQWNTYRQQRLISSYESKLESMSKEDLTAEWEKAKAYNSTFTQNNIYGDVFGAKESGGVENTEYWKVLNIDGDGVMGYLTIPKIHIKLSIYHGTADEVLETGVGHMDGTKLPIGGESNHTVLSAHRGLPAAKLFTDIDQLQAGDRFYLHILDEDLAYEVDEINAMVDKDDMDTLNRVLQVTEGQDYVTLFTCTPYGVNTHRLLVRGHRVPYDGELKSTPVDTMVESIQNYYMLFLLFGLAIALLAILILRNIYRRKERAEKKQAESNGTDKIESRKEGR